MALALLAALAFLGVRTVEKLPENWKPWGKVRLDQKPTSLANLQLNVLSAMPKACLAALDRSDVDYVKLPYRALKDGCGLSNGVRMSHAYNRPFQATCGLAAALTWYRRALDKDAEAVFHAHLKQSITWAATPAATSTIRRTGRGASTPPPMPST